MRIAITGATGNIGTAIVRRLTAEGGHDVVGLARRLPEHQAEVDPVEWHHADLTSETSGPVLRRAFTGADAVVHLAWGFQPTRDQAYLERLDVGGTRRVLDAAAAVEVPHLVHMSSIGAYSPRRDERPVDESWPTDGIDTSPYSRHKAAAERLLDAHEARGGVPLVARIRPGIVGQRSAASALLRYAVPGYVPARALDLVPLLPLDRTLAIPMVHAEDVADAVSRVLNHQATGAFNVAADPVVTPGLIADVLGARAVHVPAAVLRQVVSASWRARVQKVSPGWFDLAMQVPRLDTTKARDQLGWRPTVSAEQVLAEVVDGMREAAAARTPVLRPRTVLGQLSDLLHRGPITERPRP